MYQILLKVLQLHYYDNNRIRSISNQFSKLYTFEYAWSIGNLKLKLSLNVRDTKLYIHQLCSCFTESEIESLAGKKKKNA